MVRIPHLTDLPTSRAATGARHLSVWTAWLAMVLGVIGGALLAACTPVEGTTPRTLNPQQVPANFALDITIIGEATANGHAWRTARYVLEPDRTLRVGVGPGAATGGFPPIWRRLSRSTIAELWRQINRDHLLAEPTSPLAEAALRQANQDVQRLRARERLYRVRINAGGDEAAYWTTQHESPPTASLIHALRKAAGLATGPGAEPMTGPDEDEAENP